MLHIHDMMEIVVILLMLISGNYNLIVIGDSAQNKFASRLLQGLPFRSRLG